MIRISGRQVHTVLSELLGPENWSSPGSGRPSPDRAGETTAASRTPRQFPVQVPVANGSLALPGQLLHWPTHRSFTGEPLAELHLPGSPPLLNEVLSRVLVSGARPAQRGEFTLRAFLAGRIDLVQAEAVLGVIDATDSQELQVALSQLAGGISSRLISLREDLLLHLADLEAGLDFVEEDIEFVQRDELRRRLASARQLVAALLEQASGRMLSRGRLKVVLAGLPNAGKSTLFNRLLGQQSALVSPVAGTTRDYLSGRVTHQGFSFELIDTAGWEGARNEIETAAGDLRTEQLRRAHLVIWCSPADITEADREGDTALRALCLKENSSLLDLQTKSDTLPTEGEFPRTSLSSAQTLKVSAEQGTGLPELLTRIVSRLSTSRTNSEMIGTTAARCEESLQHALRGLDQALSAVDEGTGDEVIALELRDVLDHLGRMTGRIYTDDILDRIFSRFCIGK